MKFLKLPAKIALAQDIEAGEEMNIPIEWQDGFILVNVDEIQEVVEGFDGDCSVFYKSGDSSKISLSIDDMASILGSK
jgi:hypothetical protein